MLRFSMRTRFLIYGIAFLLLGATTDNAAAQEKILAEAYNVTGHTLFRQLSGAPNIVFSPYAIGTVLAMALSGARTTTETEMLSVLKHKQSRMEIDAANGKLMAILSGYDQSNLPPACPRGLKLVGVRCLSEPIGDRCPPKSTKDSMLCVGYPTPLPWAKVQIANALVLPKRTDEISFDYVENLKSQYAADVFRGAAPSEINGWVKLRTDDRIEKILDRVDQDPAAVLLNAIYFKAAWALEFKKTDTSSANFSLSRGRQIKVPTLHSLDRFASVTRAGYRAIRIPYAVKTIAMILVLPNDIEGAAQVAERLTEREFSEMLAVLRKTPTQRIALALPRFKASYQVNLREALQQIGLSTPFSSAQADFGGMIGQASSKGRLSIGQFRHAAVIEVDELGTEAAQVTAIDMDKLSNLRGDSFLVDRPFLFYVVDDKTGAIVFHGRISNPG